MREEATGGAAICWYGYKWTAVLLSL